MERFHFFASSCQQYGNKCKSLSELKRDESESDGALATILKILKRIHSMLFGLELGVALADSDVRQLLKELRKEVLKGCKVVFSGVFSIKFQAEHHPLWKMAEQLGANAQQQLIHQWHTSSPQTQEQRSLVGQCRRRSFLSIEGG